MLSDYIHAAMQQAEYEQLDDSSHFGRIPGFQGAWAVAPAIEGCRDELQEVLEDWLLLGLRLGHSLPVVDGLDLNVRVA